MRWALLHSAATCAVLSMTPLGLSDEKGRPAEPPSGPFGYSLMATADRSPLDLDFVFLNRDCAVCHPRQLEEIEGSMHSVSHTESFYRSFAETARQEAGDRIYAFCSGCHAPAGVASGLIPTEVDSALPPQATAGVACDVCHQICALTGVEGPWKEPGNASFVLQLSETKYGPHETTLENRRHTGQKLDFFAKSEFCASCHTVIHPINGFVIEHTYGEWKSSVYAERGIQCQDCHMRSVEDSLRVAQTLRPVEVTGQSAENGPIRPIFPHYFVGGNANADRLGGGALHAQMAEARLKIAAKIELKLPRRAEPGRAFKLDLLVHNVAAGHNLPTGVTELRQMWVELRVTGPDGTVLFERGALGPSGELPPDAIAFGAVAGDAQGEATVKLWEMARFLRKRTIPPKAFSRDTVEIVLPSDLSGEILVEAKLFYRSAPPAVVSRIMGKTAFVPKIVEMASARGRVPVGP